MQTQTQIELQDFLLVIAQVSITLGGFAGLVKVLSPAGLEIRDIIGIRLTLEHTFAALFAALLPLMLWYSGVRQPEVWRLASVPVAVFLAAELVSQSVKIARYTRRGFPPRHPWALRLHFLPFTMAFLLLMIANVWRWQSEAVYAWALVWLLNPPCVQLYLSCFLPEGKMSEGTRRI